MSRPVRDPAGFTTCAHTTAHANLFDKKTACESMCVYITMMPLGHLFNGELQYLQS